MEVTEKKHRNNKGGKVLANIRRKNALKRLIAQYETFKNAVDEEGKHLDKPARIAHKWVNGKSVEVEKPGRPYATECKRFETEIARLKANIQ